MGEDPEGLSSQTSHLKERQADFSNSFQTKNPGVYPFIMLLQPWTAVLFVGLFGPSVLVSAESPSPKQEGDLTAESGRSGYNRFKFKRDRTSHVSASSEEGDVTAQSGRSGYNKFKRHESSASSSANEEGDLQAESGRSGYNKVKKDETGNSPTLSYIDSVLEAREAATTMVTVTVTIPEPAATD
jgi:hypothetical protein